MRALAPCLPLCLMLLAPPALADVSSEIGQSGLTATEARLAALTSPADADRFALAGVRFLKTVEATLQTRWQSGYEDQLGILPFLRLPVPANPAPAPFDPGMIANLFRDVSAGMDAARAPLAEIADTSDFALEIRFSDLWFDINANTTRDPGEDLLQVAGPMILGWRWMDRDPATPAPVVRFDVADAAWLAAYTHLLGGIADVVLTYDPTAAITTTMDARARMQALRAVQTSEFDINASIGDAVDALAVVIAALDQTPDAARAASAHQHFLAMIADNRRFWAQVVRETDNDREWLPYDAQSSALGITVPQGTRLVWLAVLADAEALLTGDLLAPYWRLDDSAGVNVARLFTDPAPIDLAGWIQGAAALPYLEKGPVITAQNWRSFQNLVGGEAMLFSVFLN